MIFSGAELLSGRAVEEQDRPDHEEHDVDRSSEKRHPRNGAGTANWNRSFHGTSL